MRGGGDQELFIEARVIHIVSHGSYQGRHFFQRTQVLTKEGLLDEAGHGLGHIGRMHPIVVGVGPMVVLLYKGRSILVPKIPKIATRCHLSTRKLEVSETPSSILNCHEVNQSCTLPMDEKNFQTSKVSRPKC